MKMQFNIVLISEVVCHEFSFTQILISLYDTFYTYRHVKSHCINNTNLVRRKSHNSFSCNFINFRLISMYYLINILAFISICCIPS